jgi:hypothetical protein
MTCETGGCESPVKAKSLCKRHYDAQAAAKRRGGHLKLGDFCRRGHKIEGDNAQTYLNHGIERVRCAECNRIKPNIKLQIGDVCIYGHKIEGDNIHWIKNSKNGLLSLRCKTCDSARKDRYRQAHKDNAEWQAHNREVRRINSDKKKEKSRVERYEKILAVEVTQSSGSYTGLKYLSLNKRNQRVWEPLEEKFSDERSLCYKNPTRYIDYDEDNPPSKKDAFKLCNGCPMLVECGRFASAYKPPVGVWAGEVWQDGKVMYK